MSAATTSFEAFEHLRLKVDISPPRHGNCPVAWSSDSRDREIEISDKWLYFGFGRSSQRIQIFSKTEEKCYNLLAYERDLRCGICAAWHTVVNNGLWPLTINFSSLSGIIQCIVDGCFAAPIGEAAPRAVL
jgi:hypothetical protein